MSDGRRIVFRRTGGPDVLEVERFDPPATGPGEVLVRHESVGVNFIDTYHRSGLYPLPLPATPGVEAAGVVEAIGPGVTDFAEGDRVAWYAAGPGGYATHCALPADKLIALPDGISAETAAASLLKGCTAEMLIEQCARVRADDWVLVHAAAGGVGGLAVQWLKAIGAKVIAHAGNADKAAIAKGFGAEIALSCPLDSLAERVRAATDGKGVSVVLDGVGQASWTASLASVAKRGILVSYGNASGPVPPVAPLALTRAGSIFLTRPSLFDYADTPVRMRASAGRLFSMIESGKVGVPIGLRMPLEEAAEAHRRLEARETTGSVVLRP